MSDRLIFALCLTLPLWINLYLRQPLFRPSGLIAAVWCAALLGAEAFAPDFVFTEHAGWAILMIVGSFVAGDLWIMLMVRRRGSMAPAAQLVPLARMKLATTSLGVLSIIGAVWQFAAYAQHVGGVGELFSAGGAIRALWAEHEISIPIYARVMATFGHAGVVLALTAWSRIGRRWWMVLPILGVLIFSVSLMGRIGVLMMAVDVFLIAYYRDVASDSRTATRRLIRRAVPALLAVAAIFAVGEVLRASSDIELGSGARTFATYAFSGPAALSEWMRSAHVGAEPAWGAQSFDSIAGLLGVKQQLVGVYDEYAQLSRRHDDLGNIYTIIRPLIEDFGLLGGCAFMAALGAVAGFAFERMRAGSLAARALSCALGLYIVFTVITPLTVFNSWTLSAVLPPLLLIPKNRSCAG